jgi:hypothetical protein
MFISLAPGGSVPSLPLGGIYALAGRGVKRDSVNPG